MADNVTIKELKIVADLIGFPIQPLGVKLGIDVNKINNLVRPLEDCTQNAARMLNKWYALNPRMTPDELKEKLCYVLREKSIGRNDIASTVDARELQTEKDIQLLFQDISGNLINKWKDIGILLDVPWDDLDAIKPTPNPCDNPALEMLLMWYHLAEPRSKLITALTGRADIIKAIEHERQLATADSTIDNNTQAAAADSKTEHKTYSKIEHKTQPPAVDYKLPSPGPDQLLHDDTDLDVENAAAAGCLPKLKKLFKKHGFIPNTMMKEDLQHMVDELKKAHPVPKVLIAVLDSGIWAEHPRLKRFLVKASKNFMTDADADVDTDETNHGTIMAGILVEFAGICVEIVSFKVYGGSKGTLTRFQEAGMMAIKSWETQTKRKVDIVLTSINEKEPEYTVKEDFDVTLTDLAQERIIICAAANITQASGDGVRYPATHDHVLAIGSLDDKGLRSTFSTKGHALNFLFPGEQFRSTSRPPVFPGENGIKASNSPDDWMIDTKDGTSFASPHAAAAAAVILAYTEHTLGVAYRKALTRTKTMQHLLIAVCEQEHKVETGYGYPQLRKLKPTMIKEKVKKMCKEMKVPTTLVLD